MNNIFKRIIMFSLSSTQFLKTDLSLRQFSCASFKPLKSLLESTKCDNLILHLVFAIGRITTHSPVRQPNTIVIAFERFSHLNVGQSKPQFAITNYICWMEEGK